MRVSMLVSLDIGSDLHKLRTHPRKQLRARSREFVQWLYRCSWWSLQEWGVRNSTR